MYMQDMMLDMQDMPWRMHLRKVEEVRLQSQQLRLQLQVPWPAFVAEPKLRFLKLHVCIIHYYTLL